MKRLVVLWGFLILFCFPLLNAQEVSSLDWDIDTLFDELPPEDNQNGTGTQTAGPSSTPAAVPVQLKQRGFYFSATFDFIGGIAPGCTEAPWFAEGDNEFSWGQKVKMRSSFSLDAQISQVFRVRNTVYFEIPYISFTLGEFFFDYNFYNRVFIRAGRYNLSWGLASNFNFTDLLSRIPSGDYHTEYPGHYGGDSHIIKIDVPVGIGGFQLLAMTRANLMGNVMPGWKHIGYGAKYNLALRWADFDLGFFYHDYMPLRGFLSIKTTLGKTELYNEWLAVDFHKPEKFSGAVNIGFVHEFFNNKLRVNGELFYNGEKGAEWYRPETVIREAGTSPFIEGFNGALNLLYRFGGKGSPRIFLSSLYAPFEKSFRVIPGFTLSPFSHVEFYLAVPLDLGSKTGYYYMNPEDPDKRHFSVVILFTFKGSVQAGYNY